MDTEKIKVELEKTKIQIERTEQHIDSLKKDLMETLNKGEHIFLICDALKQKVEMLEYESQSLKTLYCNKKMLESFLAD